MSRALQILMPMGGLGQRFRDAGFKTPKPLIEVLGKPMFQRALQSFDPYNGPKQHIFVVRQDAEDELKLATRIKQLQPDAQIAMLHENTRGAVETCLLARDLINNDEPLIIMDCDLYFESAEYFEYVRAIADDNAYDGALVTFHSDDPRYSYAKADANNIVVETAEKKVISSNAICGAYCFGNGRLFKDTADKLLMLPISDTLREYYTSYLYNQLIKDGKNIMMAKLSRLESYGTPDELREFLARQLG